MKLPQRSFEFFYFDREGRPTDRALHEEILGESFPVEPGEPVKISFPRQQPD
jgi:hypothetical protein